MDYLIKPKYHYRPHKGWINDPNGLVYYKGYYHLFYQHSPDYEKPSNQPMHWGHARTKDFLEWEELPIALYPDTPYDCGGCFSGTAIVKDDILYLMYASVFMKEGETELTQTISVAYSSDGINFLKYEGNPVIATFPEIGGPDFRDPAIIQVDGKYYCVIASGNPTDKKGKLLLYESDDVFNWEYSSVLKEWDNSRYTECPSFLKDGDKYLLSTSVCPYEDRHFFEIMYGNFNGKVFESEITSCMDKGPDQYAGQIFADEKGRCILISWIPGWEYVGFAEKDIGCMSVPRQIIIKDGHICGWPVEEVQHLLKDSDPALKITDSGFEIERNNRDKVVYEGEIKDIKVIRDEYVMEVFINGGRDIYTVIL